MTFFYFLLILLAFLLVITIFSSVIKFSLLLTTKHKYETKLLIIPSILNLLFWGILLFLWYKTILHSTGKDIFNIIFDIILNMSSVRETIILILPTTIIYLVFGIILQAFSFFTVNIPYNKIYNNIKMLFNKLFHIKLKINEEQKALVFNPGEERLNIFNSFIASFFTLSLNIFILLICLSIGNILSTKILAFF